MISNREEIVVIANKIVTQWFHGELDNRGSVVLDVCTELFDLSKKNTNIIDDLYRTVVDISGYGYTYKHPSKCKKLCVMYEKYHALLEPYKTLCGQLEVLRLFA